MLLESLVLSNLFNLSWKLFNKPTLNKSMRHWMKCILKLKTMRNWEKAFNTSPTLIHTTLPNPLKITNSLNSEESPLISSERMVNSNNPLSFLRKTKCTKTLLKLPNKLITPKLLKIYWNFSSKKRRNSSLLQLYTHVMNIFDPTSCYNMPGDLECMSLPCHTWFSLSLSLRPELKLFTRRMKIGRRKNNNKPNKKWTNHSILLPMI